MKIPLYFFVDIKQEEIIGFYDTLKQVKSKIKEITKDGDKKQHLLKLLKWNNENRCYRYIPDDEDAKLFKRKDR